MINYQKLGFKCGLEVHQQFSGKKLFCDCPTINSDKEPDIKIKRRLRAVAGETGEIDIAAKHEMLKGKRFIYISNSEDTCLVEYDESPPYPLNEEALETALQISLLLNAKIIDEIQVMRKTVVDGSNTSGFQRTSLVAVDGFIKTSKGKVSIPVICLEEEAAQKLKETDESTTYRLDRLGIPLIEIATAADIKDPEHAKEVASKLGMILRSTELCKRGLGTIRQDLNMSIKGGTRTEVKGFQDLKSIPKVIEKEVERQLRLIKQGKKLKQEVRKAEPDFSTSFLRPMPGAARLYPETDIPPIKITKHNLNKIKIPELLSERTFKLEKEFKLNTILAREIIKQKINFKKYVEEFPKIEPNFLAHILVEIPKEIKARYNLNPEKLKEKDFNMVLSCLNNGEITKAAVLELFLDIIKGKKINLSKYKTASLEGLEKEIKKLVKEKKGLSIGAYMGIIMSKYKGKVDGKEIMKVLKKVV